MCKPIFPLVLFAAFLPLAAQSSPDPARPSEGAPTFNDEAVVVERADSVYRFAADGSWTKLDTSIVRVQSAAALQSLAVLGFPYGAANQALDIVYVKVHKPDGSTIETPVSDVQDQPAPVTQAAPMYSDLHMKQIPVRSLGVGDKLEFQVRLTQRHAEIPGQFWGQESFGAGVVFLRREIELHVPAQNRLTLYSPEYPPLVSTVGSEKIYRWSGSQLKPPSAKNDADTPASNKPPIAWTTFSSWDEVGEWYRGLSAARAAVTPAIQSKADELTVGQKTDTEKIQALYTYVATHNHYIGVDFGIGRYQPHTAAEVLTNQYGDCKDKHTLLAALLHAKGYHPSTVLIGAGIDLNQDVPMPSAFNHVITMLDLGGELVWLDATTEVAPYRVLLATLRDKQALVIPESGQARLVKTPVNLPFPAIDHYVATAELDKQGSLKGHMEVSIRGDDEIVMRLAARQIARAQWDTLSQNYSNGSGYGVTTSATILDPAGDLSIPWHLRYDYSQAPYGEWSSFRIASFLPNVDLPSVDEKSPPKKAIKLGNPHTQIAESTIHLPPGYSADLPNAIHLKTAYGVFDKTYAIQDGSLIANFKLETLVAEIPAAEWKTYKKFVDDIGVEPWIQLTARERVAGEKGPPLAGENNPVAAQLVSEVHDAIVARNYTLARQKADQALAINDKQAYLWSQRGYIAGMANDFAEAANDYEREFAQHPEHTDQYPGLIYAEDKAGRHEKEREYLIAYAKAVPDNIPALEYTGGRLTAEGHLDDALAIYRAGVKAVPANRSLQVDLGGLLLRMGKIEEGSQTVKAALEGCDDPLVLNNGAYVLATHTKDFAFAESSAIKANDLFEAESAQVELAGVNARTFQRVSLMIATWDTLGWVYYLDGKYDLALQYLRAAWAANGRSTEGSHLGQVLDQQDRKLEAMRVYEMALSSIKAHPEWPLTKELQAKVDALKRQGVKQQLSHPETDLQNQRTFHLPRPAALKGSASFLLQASAHGANKVKLISGDPVLQDKADAIAHLNLNLFIPPDSKAVVLRSGILFCSSGPTCDFVLTPAGTVSLPAASEAAADTR